MHKGPKINPKKKNDDEFLRWSIISTLNYKETTEKEFEKIFKKKNKHEDKDFSSHQGN